VQQPAKTMLEHLFYTFGFPQLVAMLAVAAGAVILATPKGTPAHRKRGRAFAGLALLAIGSGVIRHVSTSSIISLLVIYLLLSGWRLIYTRDAGPNGKDLVLLICAVPLTLLFVPVVLSDLGDNELLVPWLFYGAFTAMCAVLAYDLARWFLPGRWHALLWRREHIARMILGLSGVVSAVVFSMPLVHLPWVLVTVWLCALAAILWFAGRARTRVA
jgi:uncharacterized membrane protein